MVKLLESDDFLFLSVAILFLVINFEPKVSIIYLGMILITWKAYSDAINRNLFTIPPLRKASTSIASGVLFGLMGYVVFLVVTSIVLGVGIQAAVDLSASSGTLVFSSQPVLEQSKVTSFILWGQLIPYLETLFFPVTIMLWVAVKYNFSLDKPSHIVILMAVVAGIATLFHVTAKGAADNTALIITFIFFAINTYLVIKFREKIQAFVMHLVGNTIAISSILGIKLIPGLS